MLSSRPAPPTLSSPVVSDRLSTQSLRSSGSSWRGWGRITDKVFALVSIAVVVVACVIALRAWTEPGWTQIASFALMFLLVRALLGSLFESSE